MQTYSDLELIDFYKKSNQPDYLGELFARHSAVMYRTAIRIMKEPSDADDIMQIACIKMIKDIKDYKGTGSIVGWILQLVIHSCYNHKNAEKNRRNRDQKFMSERVLVTESKNCEMTEVIENHLNKLPEKYKIPISLQIIEGLSIKEVSDVLSLPEKTIRTQISRGLEKLKISLGNAGITASMTGLSEMLIAIKQPVIPEIFKSNHYFHSIYQSKAASSVKITVVKKTFASWIFKSVLYLMIPASALSVVIFVYFKLAQNDSLKTEQKLILANKDSINAPASIMQQTWGFETENELNDFKFLQGAGVIVNGKGIDNTNCLEVDKNSLLEVDISKFKLPLKINFLFDRKVEALSLSKGIVFLKSNYQEDKNIFYFNRLSPPESVNLNKNRNNNKSKGYYGVWLPSSIYVTEDCIDLWFHGKRAGLIFGSSIDNKKLFISIYDKSIIDNLTIESIDAKAIPNISKYKDYVKKIPFEKGFKPYFKLINENENFGLEKNAAPELGYCDKENMEKALGLSQP